MFYILQIFLYYSIQGLKNLIFNGNSPRQRDFFVPKIQGVKPCHYLTHCKRSKKDNLFSNGRQCEEYCSLKKR